MAFLEGKTPTEKKQIIAAGVLGLVALVALYLAFGRSFFGGSSTASTQAKPTPRPTAAPSSDTGDGVMPALSEQLKAYESTPIDYQPGGSAAADPGRNIFSFREPDPPCPTCPVKTPTPESPKTPPPTPTPVFYARSLNIQNIYAGSKGFRLEVDGDRFTPDARIYFNQSPMPTTFINQQRLTADIPADLIAQAGTRQVIVQTPDGKAYSEQLIMSVQEPPQPTVEYIGMIGRKRYNNDTAYFTEDAKSVPFGARLNDIVNNRFRLVAITPAEVTLQDVDLGFKHRVPITKQIGGGMPGAGVSQGGKSSPTGAFAPFNPGAVPAGDIPGIPNNIQRYSPAVPQPAQPTLDSATQKKQMDKKDVDDNGDD